MNFAVVRAYESSNTTDPNVASLWHRMGSLEITHQHAALIPAAWGGGMQYVKGVFTVAVIHTRHHPLSHSVHVAVVCDDVQQHMGEHCIINCSPSCGAADTQVAAMIDNLEQHGQCARCLIFTWHACMQASSTGVARARTTQCGCRWRAQTSGPPIRCDECAHIAGMIGVIYCDRVTTLSSLKRSCPSSARATRPPAC